MATCARLCARVHVCVSACVRASGPARPRRTFASVVPPLALHQHFPRSALFLSFFALSVLLSPLSSLSSCPVTVAPTTTLDSSPLLECPESACSDTRSVPSPLQIPTDPRNSACTACSRTLLLQRHAGSRERSRSVVVDVLPGQEAGPAVPRRVPRACLLSAANKVIVVAEKAPGGKRAILLLSSVYTMLHVSHGVWPQCVYVSA